MTGSIMDLRRRDYMLPPLAALRAALAPLRGAAHRLGRCAAILCKHEKKAEKRKRGRRSSRVYHMHVSLSKSDYCFPIVVHIFDAVFTVFSRG
jgi:hypothetical protein